MLLFIYTSITSRVKSVLIVTYPPPLQTPLYTSHIAPYKQCTVSFYTKTVVSIIFVSLMNHKYSVACLLDRHNTDQHFLPKIS